MKESVTKFDLEAAFKALDELEIPVAKKGIAANRVNLKETFNRKLKTEALIEDYYDVNDTNDLEQASEDRQAEVAQAKLARIEKIVDLDAETEEDILPSYEGKVIVQCPQCMTLFYKNPEDVEASEDDDTIVNVGEVCQHCGNESGYTVIGKVAAVEPEAEESEEETDELNLDFDEPVDEDSEEEPEEEKKEESEEEPTKEEPAEDLDLEELPMDEEEPEEEKKEESLNSEAKLVLTEDVDDEIEEQEEAEEDIVEEPAEEVEIEEETVEEEPSEKEDALKVLKDKIDIQGEDDTIVIAEKGQLDNEEAPKIEVEVSEEESDVLKQEFHEEETEETTEEETEEPTEEPAEKPEEEAEDDVKEALDNKEETKIVTEGLQDMDRFEMQQFLEDNLGTEETLAELVNAMSEDQMKDLFEFIAKNHDLDLEDDEEIEESLTEDADVSDAAFQELMNSEEYKTPISVDEVSSYWTEDLSKENVEDIFKQESLKESYISQTRDSKNNIVKIGDSVEIQAVNSSPKYTNFKWQSGDITRIARSNTNPQMEGIEVYFDKSHKYGYFSLYYGDEFEKVETNKMTLLLNSLDNSDNKAELIKEADESDFEETSIEKALNSVEDIDDKELTKLVTESLQRVYENVNDFTLTECTLDNNKFTVTGTIKFNSGNTRQMSYIFTEATVSKKNSDKIILEGINPTLDSTGKFYLESLITENKTKLVSNKLNYSYHIDNNLIEKLK